MIWAIGYILIILLN